MCKIPYGTAIWSERGGCPVRRRPSSSNVRRDGGKRVLLASQALFPSEQVAWKRQEKIVTTQAATGPLPRLMTDLCECVSVCLFLLYLSYPARQVKFAHSHIGRIFHTLGHSEEKNTQQQLKVNSSVASVTMEESLIGFLSPFCFLAATLLSACLHR